MESSAASLTDFIYILNKKPLP